MEKTFLNYREESRSPYYGVRKEHESGVKPHLNNEQLATGAFLRMADSLEKIAADRVQLESERDRYKQNYFELVAACNNYERRIAGLKGWISRLKKKILVLFFCLLGSQAFAQPRPTANAGPDTSIYFPMKEILLTGKGTGVGIRYKWDLYSVSFPKSGNDSLVTYQLFNQTPADSLPNDSLPADPAIYTFRLTVTDQYNRKAYDYVTIKAYFLPMGVTDILTINSVRKPGKKYQLAITNKGEILEVFDKQ